MPNTTTWTTKDDPRWWVRRLHRHRTIKAIMREWNWSKKQATHAVDVWGFNPWERV